MITGKSGKNRGYHIGRRCAIDQQTTPNVPHRASLPSPAVGGIASCLLSREGARLDRLCSLVSSIGKLTSSRTTSLILGRTAEEKVVYRSSCEIRLPCKTFMHCARGCDKKITIFLLEGKREPFPQHRTIILTCSHLTLFYELILKNTDQ